MVRKLKEGYDNVRLEIKFNKTEYLNSSEGAMKDLEIDTNLKIKGIENFRYFKYLKMEKSKWNRESAWTDTKRHKTT